jgi:hypothetical protein
MAGKLDTAIALRIIYLLNTPFEKWPAYKEGVIDEDGNTLQKGVKSDNWTMLHRLVARLKRIIAMAPGGKSALGSAIATYLMVKEQRNLSFGEYHDFVSLYEEGEAPANNVVSTGVKAISDTAPVRDPKQAKKILKRKVID